MSNARGTRWVLRGGLSAARYVPINVAVAIGQSLGWAASWFPSDTRRRVALNLKTVMAYRGEHLTPPHHKRLVRKAFASYGRYYAEAATLPGASQARILAGIEWESGEDILRTAWQEGNGVVLALPHVGSWEWGGSMLGLTMTPMVAAAEVLEPPELFAWFKQGRERIGIDVEGLDASIGSRLMKHLRDGRVVGLLCDRDLTHDGIAVTLLGVKTTMPAGPAMLALRTGAALACGVVYSGPSSSHRAKVVGPIDATRKGSLREDVARVTQLIADQLSELIAAKPEQWHVFAETIGATDGS